MANKRMLLLSSTKLYGSGILEWCSEVVISFFKKQNVTTVLFVPYAVKNYDDYHERMSTAFVKYGLQLESIHKKENPVQAVKEAKGIYIGGGNTFLLLKTLYDNNLIDPIQEAVTKNGVPYMGSSAGSNVATCTINTTNDMPIVYPPSFRGLNLVPFNINPHYIAPDPDSKHMGETRDQRIAEYLEQDNCHSVVGLPEGSGLIVEDGKVIIFGLPAKVFQKNKPPVMHEVGSDLSFLTG